MLGEVQLPHLGEVVEVQAGGFESGDVVRLVLAAVELDQVRTCLPRLPEHLLDEGLEKLKALGQAAHPAGAIALLDCVPGRVEPGREGDRNPLLLDHPAVVDLAGRR